MSKYLTASSGFRGIRADLAARRPWYKSDWTDGHNAKTTASVFFMFFTSVAPAITFAALLEKTTDEIGVVEVCLSSSLSGLIYSVFSGQPLVILGVTGPVTILTISIYGMTKSLGIKFLPFYAWSQFFAALMHMTIAALGLNDYIKCHTFGMLIAVIYGVTGLQGMAQYFTRSKPFDSALMELIIGLGTTLTALALADATRWTVATDRVRTFISDYAPTISIILWTGLSLVGRSGRLGNDLQRVDVPGNFRTLHGRAWVVNPMRDCPPWAILFSLVPATIITVLFIFDHNVSSIMAQDKAFKLRKGSAYHLDFFVLGWCIVATGLLGIPPCNGLIPQAPLHTKSLCIFGKVERNGIMIDVVQKVYEQRYTNFLQALLTGVVCFKPLIGIIGLIPKACLDGLFLFMALSSLPGNQLWERLCLVASEQRLRKSSHDWFRFLDFATIRKFTLLQLAAAAVIFVVTLTPVAMTFPLFIAALVYVRLKWLPKMFDKAFLLQLDPLIELRQTTPDDDARSGETVKPAADEEGRAARPTAPETRDEAPPSPGAVGLRDSPAGPARRE